MDVHNWCTICGKNCSNRRNKKSINLYRNTVRCWRTMLYEKSSGGNIDGQSSTDSNLKGAPS